MESRLTRIVKAALPFIMVGVASAGNAEPIKFGVRGEPLANEQLGSRSTPSRSVTLYDKIMPYSISTPVGPKSTACDSLDGALKREAVAMPASNLNTVTIDPKFSAQHISRDGLSYLGTVVSAQDIETSKSFYGYGREWNLAITHKGKRVLYILRIGACKLTVRGINRIYDLQLRLRPDNEAFALGTINFKQLQGKIVRAVYVPPLGYLKIDGDEAFKKLNDPKQSKAIYRYKAY